MIRKEDEEEMKMRVLKENAYLLHVLRNCAAGWGEGDFGNRGLLCMTRVFGRASFVLQG